MNAPELIRRALSNYRGDDLYRARCAFKGCTAAEMLQQYGQSGQTRKEILEEYEKHELAVDIAVQWVADAERIMAADTLAKLRDAG